MTRALRVGLVLFLVALGARARGEETAAGERPIAVLAYYEVKDLPRLLRAVEKARLATTDPTTDLTTELTTYIGTYGASRDQSDAIHRLAGARYAPLFKLVPDATWTRRALPAAEAARLEAARPGEATEEPRGRGLTGVLAGFGAEGPEATADAAPVTTTGLAGTVPSGPAFEDLPAAERFAWGVELGRRFRDEIRAAESAGATVEAWQLDEISPSAAHPEHGVAVRLFVRGVLEGLHEGRKALGDRPIQGIVYISNSAFPLGSMPLDGELGQFWATLDRTCSRIAGEEYPSFEGSAEAAATHEARLQSGLAKLGGVPARLSRRYVSVSTPGSVVGEFLGGNVAGLSRPEEDAWRRDYLRARVAQGVSGLGEFDWRHGNSRASVMAEALDAVAAALSK
jgi:hypothetical protein